MNIQHEQPIFGLSAPSAAGKTWLVKRLIENGHVRGWPSVTTRPPRPGEISTDYDHRFVSSETFHDWRKAGRFVIEAEIYGHDYGLTEPVPDYLPALVLLKPSVIHPFRRAFGERAVVFGVHSENGREVAEHLMIEREQNPDDIERRLATYTAEIELNQLLIDPTKYFIASGHPQEILPKLVQSISNHVVSNDHENILFDLTSI